jgi:DNA polymerase I-like protein with 3'-5' exonuclease and polymerase domains
LTAVTSEAVDPRAVPVRSIRRAEDLDPFARAVGAAVALAIDTETEMRSGAMRVLSAATRSASGVETAWVIDARDVDAALLAPILGHRAAAAWNASFDARVIDTAVFDPAGVAPSARLRWWDAMFADALLHQGRSGFSFYHGLAWAARRHLGVEMDGKGTTQVGFDLVSDLDAEQVAYAAADAVVTLRVADHLRRCLDRAGLLAVCELEMAARPFLDRLSRCGFPFDATGYRRFLDDEAEALRRCASELAELTGGGQGNLFSPEVEPTWNPASEAQAKAALNRHAADTVQRYFARIEGRPRTFSRQDPLTATVLGEVGGPLAGALLRHRHHAKLLSTYGEGLLAQVHADGRVRPQYLQVVGTSTGRLASRFPNAQNLAPETAPFVRPAPGRVLVHADLSQAELRWMAQVSGDGELQRALAGGGDVHAATAGRMFGEDVEMLRRQDPERYGLLRARAKAINFGILYGLGARSLARTLGHGGHDVTVETAQQLLAAYLAAYPGVAGWLREHDRVVDELSANPPRADWDATFDLLDLFERWRSFRQQVRSVHGRPPTMDEALGQGDLGDADRVRWLGRFEDAVVLGVDGRPVGWETRTLAGRRRTFDIGVWGVLRTTAVRAAQRRDAAFVAVRDEYAAARGVSLADGAEPLPESELQRRFDDRPVRLAFVRALGDRLGREARDRLLERALGERIAVLGNAHRNAPIQGGVADAMLAAFASLWAWTADDPEIVPVQTVHDSVVLECPAGRADEVADRLGVELAAAMAGFCPDVAIRVDVDIRTTLAAADVVPGSDRAHILESTARSAATKAMG